MSLGSGMPVFSLISRIAASAALRRARSELRINTASASDAWAEPFTIILASSLNAISGIWPSRLPICFACQDFSPCKT